MKTYYEQIKNHVLNKQMSTLILSLKMKTFRYAKFYSGLYLDFEIGL